MLIYIFVLNTTQHVRNKYTYLHILWKIIKCSSCFFWKLLFNFAEIKSEMSSQLIGERLTNPAKGSRFKLFELLMPNGR